MEVQIVRLSCINGEKREFIEAQLDQRFTRLYKLYQKLGFPAREAAYLANIHRIDDISLEEIEDAYTSHFRKLV